MSDPTTEAGKAAHWKWHSPIRGCVLPCWKSEEIAGIEEQAAASARAEAVMVNEALVEQVASRMLSEGFALVSVEDVARRLTTHYQWQHEGEGGVWREFYMEQARRLLGIGGER